MIKPTAQSIAVEFIAHEKVCTERYGNLWDAVKELKASLHDARTERAADAKVMQERFDSISSRMWTLVCSVCGAALLAAGALAFHMMTR